MRPALAGAALAAALASPAQAGAGSDTVQAVDRTAQAGLTAPPSHTYGSTVADFDANGWDDAFVNRHYDSFPALYLNDASDFADVTATAFPTAPRSRDYHDCPVADVDSNGELDVYCTMGGRKGGRGPNPNELWLQSSGTFTEQAGPWGVRDPYGRGRQATFIEANGDGHPDLYVTNQYPRLDGRRGPNQLFVNEAGTGFRRAPELGVNGRLGGKSVQAIDYDVDGDEDLLLCGQERLLLFRNQADGGFRDVGRAAGVRGPCIDAVLASINGDSRPDLVLLRGRGLEIRTQTRRHRFARAPFFQRPIERARKIAVGDVNGDRRNDVYVLRAGSFDPELPDGAQTDVTDRMLVRVAGERSFAPIALPPVRQGIGEAVTAIDHDRNGLTDFIVQNGRLRAIGPTRLIAFVPAAQPGG